MGEKNAPAAHIRKSGSITLEEGISTTNVGVADSA
jgi:hypothetical protein